MSSIGEVEECAFFDLVCDVLFVVVCVRHDDPFGIGILEV